MHSTPHTQRYTLSLHDALPISQAEAEASLVKGHRNQSEKDEDATDRQRIQELRRDHRPLATDEKLVSSRVACPVRRRDRKSTRLNSSHLGISYAVFCLKKKISK